ncbi:hypothetical protein [Bradyrhizobium sp. NC92]|uniref:hypothetical protein n=1 Tax=Bradyrhizobium sp. (strain NC92) TaxID=55395 RepID=UPI0021AAF690|nr:hypothetical protein [Bradyrhizobium sp. NC92]UWU68184.1 hypothetical protein N2602_34625 [Bradyrhizobium sp. NC92]
MEDTHRLQERKLESLAHSFLSNHRTYRGIGDVIVVRNGKVILGHEDQMRMTLSRPDGDNADPFVSKWVAP